jgi:hypothetical protein
MKGEGYETSLLISVSAKGPQGAALRRPQMNYHAAVRPDGEKSSQTPGALGGACASCLIFVSYMTST